MTRILSGAVLLVLAVALVWFSTAFIFFIVAEVLLLVAFGEYASLARANGIAIPEAPAALGAVLTAATFSRTAFSVPWLSIDIVLLVSLIALAVFSMIRWDGGNGALAFVSASLFPCFYLGLPVGTMIYLRETAGYKALFLLVLTVAVSDSMQYFTGRAIGRHPLAAAISPKKTIEGAVGGFLFGGMFLAVLGNWWLPQMGVVMRAVLGAAIVAAGIAGDLFESMLKRSAGVKDSSALIPGHGGILDRLDALLFAAPVYYYFVMRLA
ncbi:MAG TPA: phosphatidate cytidylyltransferase [Vicinamibacterales bacterium]|nr:phosphatidate cytidylyltransferase [Vicinamibacterales bacterium]